MTTPRRTIPVGKTASDWLKIERAATKELQRRSSAAHAQILELLLRYGHAFSPRQLSAIRQRLRTGR